MKFLTDLWKGYLLFESEIRHRRFDTEYFEGLKQARIRGDINYVNKDGDLVRGSVNQEYFLLRGFDITDKCDVNGLEAYISSDGSRLVNYRNFWFVTDESGRIEYDGHNNLYRDDDLWGRTGRNIYRHAKKLDVQVLSEALGEIKQGDFVHFPWPRSENGKELVKKYDMSYLALAMAALEGTVEVMHDCAYFRYMQKRLPGF